MKLIYVTGISGSGKTTLAESFAEELTVLEGDQLVEKLIKQSFPTMNQAAPGKAAKIFRDYREIFDDPADSMESILREVVDPANKGDLLIEGVHLTERFWSQLICSSLSAIYGFEVKPSLVVFHNPPAGQIHSQYVERRAENPENTPERDVEYFFDRKRRWSKQLSRLPLPVEEFDSFEKSRQRISGFLR